MAPAPLQTLGAPIDGATWEARRQARRSLAEAALGDREALEVLLRPWSVRGGLLDLEGLFPDGAPGPAEDLGDLLPWIYGVAPSDGGGEASEAAWDRRILKGTGPIQGAPEPPRAHRVAALYLLARLGDEWQRRERAAWLETPWPSDRRDEDARQAWSGILAEPPNFDEIQRFRDLWGSGVRRTFKGLTVVLRLPPEVGEQHASMAEEQLDLLPLGAHLDIASRLAEHGDEPVSALGQTLGPPGVERVRPCIYKRDHWTRAWELLGGEPGSLPGLLAEGVALSLLLAAGAALGRGEASPHDTGLPAWGVIKANLSRIRGRLRAVVREDPEALRERVLGLKGLFRRTEAAVSRYAWAWAWREARRGFGFDPERLSAAPCHIDPRDVELHRPFSQEERRLVLTFLLAVLGRGYWEDLLRWTQEAPTETLSKSFYRRLKECPEDLADPMSPDQTVRRYNRLQAHLSDGGIEDYLPDLEAVARRVAPLKGGRGLKGRLHEALSPQWDEDAIPKPARGAGTFKEACEAFLEARRQGHDLLEV